MGICDGQIRIEQEVAALPAQLGTAIDIALNRPASTDTCPGTAINIALNRPTSTDTCPGPVESRDPSGAGEFGYADASVGPVETRDPSGVDNIEASMAATRQVDDIRGPRN